MGHIFISYSRRDFEYAQRLIRSLKREGFNPWVDKEGIKAGTRWEERLYTEIKTCDAYILILTPNSRKSEWVANELHAARNSGKPIFPLLLEDTDMFLALQQIQYEDVRGTEVRGGRRGKLPSEDFYERLAMVTPRVKKGDQVDESVGLTEEEREEKADAFAKQASFIITKGASTFKDTFDMASKVIKKTYRSVADSGVMKKISPKPRTQKSKSNKRKSKTKNKHRGARK